MKFEYKKIADTKEARWEEVTVHRNRGKFKKSYLNESI